MSKASNQQLHRDLQGLASDLKWSAVELTRIAERLSLSGHEADAQAVLRICQVMHAGEDRLQLHAGNLQDEVVKQEGKP